MVDKMLLEYVWLDGYESQNLRMKTKVVNKEDVLSPIDRAKRTKRASAYDIDLSSIPVWSFDGSSTKQASSDNSECLLSPVRVYFSGGNRAIVLCEVLNPDKTPHDTNRRQELKSYLDSLGEDTFWWGFEQEYFLYNKTGEPMGWPKIGNPEPQGMYYCGVGTGNASGRSISEEHMIACLSLGIDITGTNAEVALGQWEYQCFAKDTLKACDDLWISRFLLHRLCEEKGVRADLHPKPISGDWNGSGCHANFSNSAMRKGGDPDYYLNAIMKLRESHKGHIEGYGKFNEKRLTGKHETQHIDEFSYGIGDRGASIRIPVNVKENNWSGYLEDRRPASNCNPYKVTNLIINTILS